MLLTPLVASTLQQSDIQRMRLSHYFHPRFGFNTPITAYYSNNNLIMLVPAHLEQERGTRGFIAVSLSQGAMAPWDVLKIILRCCEVLSSSTINY